MQIRSAELFKQAVNGLVRLAFTDPAHCSGVTEDEIEELLRMRRQGHRPLDVPRPGEHRAERPLWTASSRDEGESRW